MPKTYPVKNDFTRGKFTSLLHDKTDEAIYQNGAAELTNVFVLPHGGFTRRGGTRWAGQTRFNTGGIDLERFAFSENPKQSYVLEFGDKYLRFLWGEDKSYIIDPASLDPKLKWSFAGLGLSDVTVSGTYTGSSNRYYKLIVDSIEDGKDVLKLYIDGVVYGTYHLGTLSPVPLAITRDGITFTIVYDEGHTVGDYWDTEVYWPLTLRTPYPETAVNDLQNGIVQREDVAMIVHGTYVPRKLSRYGHTDWRLEPWLPNKSPWEPTVGLKYNLYDVTAVWGTGTTKGLYASNKGYLDYYFSETHGATLLQDGSYETSIALSLDSTFYSSIDNEFRLDLLSVIGDILHVSIEIYGSIYIPEDGDYKFSINNGYQGADLIIDGDVAASHYYGGNISPDNPTNTNFQTILSGREGTVTLDAGEHTFRARCWLGDKSRTLAIYWKKPGDTEFELIPAQYFVEHSERYGVTTAEYSHFLIGDSITLPPTGQSDFDDLFDTAVSGVTLNKVGKWDDRIAFHSQVGMTVAPFNADLPPDCVVDNTRHSFQIDGYLTISETGDYEFALDSNDGGDFRVYLTDPQAPLAVVSWIAAHGLATATDEFTHAGFDQHKTASPVTLTAGVYKFRARYWNYSKGFGFALGWKTPGETEFVIIPHSAFTPNPGYYPRCITFHEQRVFVGGMINEPQKIYASKSYDFDDFETGPEADDGLEFRIASDQVDALQWMVSRDYLYIGTLSTEYRVRGVDGYLAPDDIEVKDNTSYGSAYVRPVKAEDSIFFVDKSEKGMREYTYVLEKDKSVGINVDILAEDLFHKGIQKLCFQQGGNAAYRFALDEVGESLSPSFTIADEIDAPRSLNLLWVLTKVGELKSLTIETLEKVYAWTEQVLGGTDVIVDSITTIPGDGGDILFLAVRRTINAATVRTIEWIDPSLLCDLGVISLDSAGDHGNIVITNAHLPNEIIEMGGIILDGSGNATWEAIANPIGFPGAYEFQLDSSGVLDFKEVEWLEYDLYGKYHIIYAGYPFTSIAETLPFDIQMGGKQTSLGMMKRWVDIWLSVVNTVGVKVALAAYPDDTETMDDEGTLTTDRKRFFLLGWNREAALRITQEHPLPITVRSIFGELQVNTG